MLATGVAFVWIWALIWLLWFADGHKRRVKQNTEAERKMHEGTQPYERVIAIIGACALIAIILGSI